MWEENRRVFRSIDGAQWAVSMHALDPNEARENRPSVSKLFFEELSTGVVVSINLHPTDTLDRLKTIELKYLLEDAKKRF